MLGGRAANQQLAGRGAMVHSAQRGVTIAAGVCGAASHAQRGCRGPL